MNYFAQPASVIRRIWGKGDTVLFIFAGASAEFALNKAVDWLYFTGKLPADPIGRLFSTVVYAKEIIFSSEEDALRAIDKISSIHTAVEGSRGMKIPDWAYRDVLYMLIYYSISSFELLERKLTDKEKEEVFEVFYRVGNRMGLKDLPANYKSWLLSREEHLQNDLEKSELTVDLFDQYRKHLGNFRFTVLLEAQKMVVPERVSYLLDFSSFKPMRPLVSVYKLARKLGLDGTIKTILLPRQYISQIRELDITWEE